ncbi:MAG: hypothetical protein ABWK00_05545 [Desulfurococcaceae archaeon]
MPSSNVVGAAFYYEAARYPLGLVAAIREKGPMAGIAINSSTPVEAIEPFLGKLYAAAHRVGGARLRRTKGVDSYAQKGRELRRVRDEEGMSR